MLIRQISLSELLVIIGLDKAECRFVSRVIFVNNLDTYFELIDALSNKSDAVIRLSDKMYCKGDDTVPDLKVLIDNLDNCKNSNVLIPHLGEYLRVGEATERSAGCVYSIINRAVHSTKRVWLPIFAAKGLFQSIVGQLDEERFGDAVFEIDEPAKDFSATAYSNNFLNQPGLVDAQGLREWFELWDDGTIKTGMSFATRQIKQLTQSDGDYALSIITDPFTYISRSIISGSTKLKKEFGTEQQWGSLVPYIKSTNEPFSQIITSGLNLMEFDPYQVLGVWGNLNQEKRWLFYLWYALKLNPKDDYISYAVSKASDCEDIVFSIECSIFDCTENNRFDEWLIQRKEALVALGVDGLSSEFWKRMSTLRDSRKKFKLLTGETHDERTKIIELVSHLLLKGTLLDNYKVILHEKYQDLAFYLSEPKFISGVLSDYIYKYKLKKIENCFDPTLSNMADPINLFDYKTRGQLLFSLKTKYDAYYLWIDGMGIEWIDMLIDKVSRLNPELAAPDVEIGTAVVPTITSANMDKADRETVSEKKYNALDELSHIKDKGDCNYYSIIAKQFEMMDTIAGMICKAAKNNPNKDIIVTSDHGMSRMAALGFHNTEGIAAPSKANVYNLGRYCEMPPDSNHLSTITNTIKEDNYIAFKTHNHFTSSGNAPGEIHGGATPEEILVPIIHYKKLGKGKEIKYDGNTYTLDSPEVYLDGTGMANLIIKTKNSAESVVVEINGDNVSAIKSEGNIWNVSIGGLNLDQSYSLRVIINNIYNNETETICVKRKGLVIDDDF